MIIRKARPEDSADLVRLFQGTIHFINCQHYSKVHLDAWAPSDMPLDRWTKRMQTHEIFVAEQNGEITGFAELEGEGHIDCFYVHKDYQRQGVGTALMRQILELANNLESHRLHAEVSITARPFFEHHGFIVICAQEVTRSGISAKNFKMERILS